ncbi:MAG: hypothetical protein QOJ35_2476 [Solirubrobacteraceae bacterium]|jgi:hypothetical protein|nr:hypothetical protein [Solirubrobacteraceae bacterium]
MRFKTSRIVASIAVIGAVAAGGAAFTASNTLPDTVAGYGSSTISGATVSSLSYVRSSDGATITAANLVIAGDMTGKTVQAAFNSSALSACTVGTYDGTTETPVACTGFTQDSNLATAFHVAVTD